MTYNVFDGTLNLNQSTLEWGPSVTETVILTDSNELCRASAYCMNGIGRRQYGLQTTETVCFCMNKVFMLYMFDAGC